MTEPNEVVAARKAVKAAKPTIRMVVFQSEALRLFGLVRQSKLDGAATVKALHEIAFSNGIRAGEAIQKAMQECRGLPDYPSKSNGVASQPVPGKIIKATPFVCREPSLIPPRAWLYGRHFVRQYMSTTVAPGGVGKSSLAIIEALAMVTGRDLLNVRGGAPAQPIRVWYWNGEDPLEETERRIAAACLYYKITPADIGGRLFIDSGRDTPVKIATEQKSGISIAIPVVEQVTKTIIDNQIDAMIVDPFVSSHSINENDNMKTDAVAKTWGAIAGSTNCAIDLPHHVRKGAHGQF
jgi:hypothetical protein